MTHTPAAGGRWPPQPLQRIVCGTDFSPAAERALARAALFAREHGATLVPAHVIASSLWDDASARLAGLFGTDMPAPEALQAAAVNRLREWAAGADPDERFRCEPAVCVGRAPAELARLAAEPPADLLVVGDRGGHSLRELVLGTTAQKLLRTSPCPVLVVKRAAELGYANVLVPTDFSEPSRAALRATAALLPHAVLHLAHAFELPFDGIVRADVSEATRRHYLQQAERNLRAELHVLADQLGLSAARRVLHVAHGYPATCIERWAEQMRVDLVALAAFGKSGLERAFLGSVSLHAVAHAGCDVLLLRGIE
ncbi:MAG: universal stress protein [Rubrivivax sp.]|nr:universal stress protein [Rubrivivax sp.]